MIGNDEENEEVLYKVADKRKFNADGSVREGITLDAAPIKESPTPEPNASPDSTNLIDELPDVPLDESEIQDLNEGDEMPGAKDPASFVNFLSTIATNAAASLGAVPHPATGQRSLDLDSAKYWLDILAMLKDKTKGNLHPQESKLVDGLLGDMRMQYVHLIKATEEKLKAQAGQKISGDDLLGKR